MRSLYEGICDVANVAPEGRVILLRWSYESTPSPPGTSEHNSLCHTISASWLTTVLNSTEIFPRSSYHFPWHWTFSCSLYDSTTQTALFQPPVPGSRLILVGFIFVVDLWYDIFVICNWVDPPRQSSSTPLERAYMRRQQASVQEAISAVLMFHESLWPGSTRGRHDKLSRRPPKCRRDAGDPLDKYAGTVRRAGAHSSSMWCTLLCCVCGEDRCLLFCSSL